MNLSCLKCQEFFVAGHTASIIVHSSSWSDFGNFEVSAQAFGYILFDERWQKSGSAISKRIFEKSEYGVASSSPGINAKCILASSLVKLIQEDLIIQFDLPHDALHSFRGLYFSVIYFIDLIAQRKSDGIQDIRRIPFSVQGFRESFAPFYTRVSVATTTPLRDRNIINSTADVPSMEESVEQRTKESDVTFVLKMNDNTVCSIYLESSPSSSGSWAAGDTMIVKVEFPDDTDAIGNSRILITGRLLQTESSPEGEDVQENIIHSCKRSASNAVHLTIPLHIPTTAPCSFKSFLNQVKYAAEIEIGLKDGTSGRTTTHSWRHNVHVAPCICPVGAYCEMPSEVVHIDR